MAGRDLAAAPHVEVKMERDSDVLDSELEGDTYFPFTPCSSCDPIYNELQKQVKESGIFDIPSFRASAYRVGPLNPGLRGLFFSADFAGAQAYERLHAGHEVKKYSIDVGRTVVAGHQSKLIKLFFNKSMHDLQYEYSQKVKGDSNWWAKVDAKIMREAKRRGYDAIIYTRPAAPASIEVVVFSNRGVREVKEATSESTGTSTWLRRRSAMPSTDIYVTGAELVPGLEPSSADDIATAVYCSFTVAGPALARVLGAQLRTLSRRVEKTTPEQALSAVKRSPAVLDVLEAAARRAVRSYVANELMEHPPRSSDLEVDLSEATDWTPLARFTKGSDGAPQLVVQELELNVILL